MQLIMDSLETPITLDTRHKMKTYRTKNKTTGDNTSAHGKQAVPASYETHTKCLNNQWVTVNSMHEMIKNQIYFFILDGRNRFFHLVNIRVVKISLHFAKFNAFHRTNIIHMTIYVSWKLNIYLLSARSRISVIFSNVDHTVICIGLNFTRM